MIITDGSTDFWRDTYYGFIRDNGHAYLAEVAGDFTISVDVSGDYRVLYDQAGLFIRLDERRWIKAGIEYTDGTPHLSVVVTDQKSDWSMLALAVDACPVSLRLNRHSAAIRVQYREKGGSWQLVRLCPFSVEIAYVGVIACSLEREGFQARFSNLKIEPAITEPLHQPQS